MKPKLNNLAVLAAIASSLFTAGCFETKDEYTINPDGSGKVVHESIFRQMDFSSDQSSTPEEIAKSAVKHTLESAKGVEAWRDVTFKALDDGRISFRGTAYFKDLAKFEIPNQSMLEFTWKQKGFGSAVLDLQTNKSTTPSGVSLQKKAPVSTNQLSPEEFAKKLKVDRAKFEQAKPMLSGFLGTMKHSVVLHLPGKVTSSSNFVKNDSSALAINFEGKKLLDTMEKLINDDEWCRRHHGTGFDNMQEKPMMDDEISALMFGTKAPVRATVSDATTPLFDFAAEVAAAKKDFAKVERDLGIRAGALAPPATGQPLRKVEVVGTRLITFSDQKQDIRPFNYDVGYTVVLLIEFPGSILSITDKTAVETAVADDGSSLLPESEWNRNVHFPHVSKDKTKGMVELELKMPNKTVHGLKELSGHVQYTVSSATKEVDLGFKELKAGSKGTALGAKIRSIEPGWNKDGSERMQIEVDLRPTDVKTLWLVVNGEKTVLEQNGWSGGGNTSTLTYACKTAFPPNGGLVAEVYDKLQTFEAPFKLENITLSGTKQ